MRAQKLQPDGIQEYLNGPAIKVFTCPANLDEMQGGSQATQVSKMIANAKSGCGFNVFLPISYAFNEAVLGWAGPTTGGGVGDHERLRGLVTRVPHPADVILLGDSKPRNGARFGAYDGWMVFDDHLNTETLATAFARGTGDTGALFDFNRHYGNMNILCCDGHGETLKLPAQYLMTGTDNSTNANFIAQLGALQSISVSKDFH